MEHINKRSFAVFIDMENVGGKKNALETIIETLKIRGDILVGKVYGYSDRYSDLKDVILSNTFNAVPSLRYGSSQKNSLDIQLVVDALDVAYQNPRIDSFCIVSGDSDFTPLVGRLKSMGKYVLGISRSESASSVFINACNEFLFLETSVSQKQKPARKTAASDSDESVDEEKLIQQIESILTENSDNDGFMLASQLKNVLLRLRPDFNERAYGHSSFGKLLLSLESKYGTIKCQQEQNSLKITLSSSQKNERDVMTKENWLEKFQNILDSIKADGFERVNPSIIKQNVCSAYPDFSEREIGFRRFNDIMRALERQGRIKISYNGINNMLITII